MAHYSLFFPGRVGGTPDHLTEVGLGSLCEHGGPEFSPLLGDSPTGKPGVYCSWRDHVGRPSETHSRLSYDRDCQLWSPCAKDDSRGVEKGDFWIGFDAERLMVPEDVAYKKQQRGYEIELGDGNQWRIPSVEVLPKVFGVDLDSGAMLNEPEQRYAGFCHKAEAYAELIFSEIRRLDAVCQSGADVDDEPCSVEYTLKETFEYCCDALAINYRLHWQVVNAMRPRLLTESLAVYCLLATIDYHQLVETRELKKKEPTVLIAFG